MKFYRGGYGTGRLNLSEERSILKNNGLFVPILINEILGARKRVNAKYLNAEYIHSIRRSKTT